jgi:hypothetical protein
MATAHTDSGGFQEISERNEASIERRSGRRFSLRLSCRVCLVSTERAEFAGTAINISRSGILVGLDAAQISSVLKPDDVVRVVVDLPRHPLFSPRCMEFTATVVRIVAAEAETQVAFEFRRMQIKDQNTKAISTRGWLSAPIENLIQ